MYVSVSGQKIHLSSSKANGRVTVMGLTAATGEPVMCVCIFAGTTIDVNMAQGYDHLSEVKFDDTKSLEYNSGPGKALPGFPTCRFRGKDVPALICATPKGSMTSEILKKMLEKLDELNV